MSFSFLGGLPFFDVFPRLSYVLAPSGTYRVYAKRVKFAGVESAYYHGRCFLVDITQKFTENEGAECTCRTQRPRLTSFLPVVAVLADSVVEPGIDAIHVLLP